MKNITINRQPLELFKLLKLAGLVASGGEGKYVISEGLVKLNGQVETRKARKIFAADIIEFNGQALAVVLQEGA